MAQSADIQEMTRLMGREEEKTKEQEEQEQEQGLPPPPPPPPPPSLPKQQEELVTWPEYYKSSKVQLVTRQEFEEKLDKKIEEDTFAKIRRHITPYQICKCETNGLEKSLEVSYKLRKRAQEPDAEDFNKLGAKVEDFAFYLMDPVKKDDELKPRYRFKDQDFDRIIDKAVAYQQMKFLSHPVVYMLLMKRWKGQFQELRPSLFLWVLLHVWAVFDVVLFFLVFALLNSIRICGAKKMADWYIEYFTTPYFKFVRDTISYLVLVLLHYALCLQPSSLQMTFLEWVILVFFIGRLLMEIDQAISSMKIQKNGQSRWKNFIKMLSKYLGDWWNRLDVLCLVIFIAIMVLRFISWSHHGKVSGNRTLAVASYLYGLNTMFLSLRVFGQICESHKFTGSIQIALFHIISAVIAILGQFFSVLLAFSFAITKIYQAEKSYDFARNTSPTALCKSEKSLSCWQDSFLHLTWSLLGNQDSEQLHLPDGASEILAKILYAVFLIMGAVMLLNMLIALLTNTYQKVEDNAFYEWSYKKAMTISTYCDYHPVPVPFNIVSLLFKLLRYIYRSFTTRTEENNQRDTNGIEFTKLIKDLQSKYFSAYGFGFPITDEQKTSNEVKACHHFMGNIASRSFDYSSAEKQHIKDQYGSENWVSRGIQIDGQQISYVDCDCDRCKTDDRSKYNGAYLRTPPLTRKWPKFEVLIQACGRLRTIAIGLVGSNWDPHDIPGDKGNSAAYLIHEGKVFYRENNEKQAKYMKDLSAFSGDVIGCELLDTVNRDENSLAHATVQFTLNGKFIGDAPLAIEDGSNNPFQFRPFIGIGIKGTSLLFRMRPKEPLPSLKENEMKVLMELFEGIKEIKNEVKTLRHEVKLLKGQ